MPGKATRKLTLVSACLTIYVSRESLLFILRLELYFTFPAPCFTIADSQVVKDNLLSMLKFH